MHRKQNFSYETSGRNPKDLDLLDEGSEDEIQSLTLEDRTNVFCRCRGWLVDPRNYTYLVARRCIILEIQSDEVQQRAAPPRCPHVRLDEDINSLIPQARGRGLDDLSSTTVVPVMMTISTCEASPNQARGEGEEEVAQHPRVREVRQLLVWR